LSALWCPQGWCSTK